MANNDTTQSKYRKIRKPTEQPKIEDNEVRITTQGRVKKYVDYSLKLLQGIDPNAPNDQQDQRNQQQQQQQQQSGADKTEEKEPKQESAQKDDASKDQKNEQDNNNNVNANTGIVSHLKKFDSIVLKATGLAINKAVVTAEVVKRRVGGLHQLTDLKTLEIEDTWDPLEEGLHVVKTTRRVASIIIKLSCDSNEIEKMKNEPGYQAPIATESIKTGSARRGGGMMGGSFFGQGGGQMRYRGGGQNRMQGGRRGGFRGNRQGGGGGFRGGFRGNGQGNFRGGGQGGFRGGGGQGQGFRGGRQQGGQPRRGFRGGGQGFRGGRGGGRGGGNFRGGGMRNQQVRAFQ